MKMIWKGRELYTVADIVIALDSLRDEGEARAFKAIYISAERAIGVENAEEIAKADLSYVTTFLEEGDMERVKAWLEL